MTRAEAINYLTSTGLTEEQVMEVVEALEQEPKTGHWEWVRYDSNPNIGNWHCSVCRTIIPRMPEETDNTPIYKVCKQYRFCPNCGAKMVESQESEE